ncbi:MAG TPA: translation initiation factor IF-2 [Dehalococcoidia bacterium]|nr:translation initiation factor IF-2 [Dehalococcoidia bacterium]
MVSSGKQPEVKPADGRAGDGASSPKARVVEIDSTVSVKQLAELLQASPVDTIKHLMRRGVMANVNQFIDYDIAAVIAVDYGYQPRLKPEAGKKGSRITEARKKRQLRQAGEQGGLQTRPPVVTIMGHVNHGKTRLLDAIRQTNVMEQEAGGITQHIGAYQVEIKGEKITFLDTPGHEAFTAMRARGAQVTDITILVVAADDGVMPQTLEAIDHARAAGVPIMVAINKIDKADANPDLVKQQLADAGLLIEEWGGDTVCVEISAREKIGIDNLLENLMVVAEVEDLKADPSRPAEGVAIEAEMDKTQGPLCTVLVHSGTLKVGDVVVVGETSGRLKAMFNDAGKRVRRAGPSDPVVLLGMNSVPQVGDLMTAVSNEREAQALIDRHRDEMERERTVSKGISLSNVFDQVSAGQVKELNIILKVDVQGSIEPIKTSLEQIPQEGVKVAVIHSGAGNITESDVMLAIASKGLIIGFSTGSEPGARRMAEVEGISIRYYDVIYNLIDDVNKALQGMLEPTMVEVVEGRAEVREVFPSGKRAKVAGVYVNEGKVTRGSSVRVLRRGEQIHESVVNSLRRFKDDVREVATGFECGVGVQGFNDFEVGDILEFFRIEEAA